MPSEDRPAAVVTGAASGIGRAVAEQLLRAGERVIGVDRDRDGLASLTDHGAEVIVADLTTDGGREAVAAAAPRVAKLVNAAGIIRMTPLDQVTLDLWDEQFRINAHSLFFLTQRLMSQLTDGAAVVNLSSTAGKTGTTVEGAVYAATKAAVLSLTRSLSAHLAPRGIRVNAVCPGIIDTPMQRDVIDGIAAARDTTPEAIDQARLKTVPLGRAATAEECAAVICFLLSDAAAYMTGQAINISGGLVTW